VSLELPRPHGALVMVIVNVIVIDYQTRLCARLAAVSPSRSTERPYFEVMQNQKVKMAEIEPIVVRSEKSAPTSI
jgi:hypothetical protein